jgi:hypothetical protein
MREMCSTVLRDMSCRYASMLNAIAIVRVCESEWQRGDRSIETLLVRTCNNAKRKGQARQAHDYLGNLM